MTEPPVTTTSTFLTTVHPGISEVYSVAKVLTSVVLIAITIITAVITLAILKRCKENESDDRSIRLFECSAVSNMFGGLSIAAVFLTSDPNGYAPFSAAACQIGKTFIYISNFQSTAFVTAITVNRFLHVKCPLQYYRIVSLRRLNTVIVTIWMISTVYLLYLPVPSFPYYDTLQADCFASTYIRASQQILTYILLMMWAVNHVFILFINAQLLKVTFDVRRSRRVAAVKDIPQPHTTTSRNVSREVYHGINRITNRVQHRGVILVISISVIYFISCLPGLIVLTFVAAQSYFFSPYVYLSVSLLGIASSVWNIIAFILFDTKFRRVIFGMFKRNSVQLV